MTEIKELHDSGKRRKFASGAMRDRGDLKPRPDLISPHAQMREGMIMTLGGEKYDLRNWEKGMPISDTLASAQRHIEQYKRGDTDEDHLAQARWNLGAIIHYEEEIKAGRMDQAIDDMPKYAQQSMLTPAACSDEANIQRRKELLKRVDETDTTPPDYRQEKGDEDIPDFCFSCGASIPPRTGEGTCSKCDPDGVNEHRKQQLTDLVTQLIPISVGGLIHDLSLPTFYITGPMRGLPFYNFPAFDGARELGRSLGYHIISPADLDREAGIDPINDPGSAERIEKENPNLLQEIVRRDIEAILDLDPRNKDGLALLPDWRKSIGAFAEIAVARFKGLRLVDARDFKTPIEV